MPSRRQRRQRNTASHEEFNQVQKTKANIVKILTDINSIKTEPSTSSSPISQAERTAKLGEQTEKIATLLKEAEARQKAKEEAKKKPNYRHVRQYRPPVPQDTPPSTSSETQSSSGSMFNNESNEEAGRMRNRHIYVPPNPLKRLFNNERFSNMKIFIKDKVYFAEKFVLQASSPVWNILLDREFTTVGWDEKFEYHIDEIEHPESFYLILSSIHGEPINFLELSEAVVVETVQLAALYRCNDFLKDLVAFVILYRPHLKSQIGSFQFEKSSAFQSVLNEHRQKIMSKKQENNDHVEKLSRVTIED